MNRALLRSWWKPAPIVLGGLVGIAVIAALCYGVYAAATHFAIEAKAWSDRDIFIFCGFLFGLFLISALGDIESAVKDLRRAQDEAEVKNREAIKDLTTAVYALRNELIRHRPRGDA